MIIPNKLKNQEKSIAVLPFVNMSSDEEQEYFSDGITEEIINVLAKIKSLKVTSRTSSFFFKGKNIPIRQIGHELNVSIILEGSIRLSGNLMRITAQLIDVQEDFHFWSETFDRSIENIFAVQDEISFLIADKLREHLGHFEIEEQVSKAPDLSIPNYQAYLKSRYYILKMTVPEINKGVEILQKLITEQPHFPQAYLGMHMSYALMGTIGLIPASEGFIKGQPYLEKAIELAPDLAECQLQLSWMSFLQEWNLPKTYEHINKALDSHPTVEAHQTMVSTLVAEAKYPAALSYINTAIQIDPFAGINYHLKGYILYAQEKYEQAIDCFKKSLKYNSNSSVSISYWGQALLLMGKYEEGLIFFKNRPIDEPGDIQRVGGMTMAYAAAGDLVQAQAGIEQLKAFLETDLMDRALYLLIICHSILKDYQKTIQYIEQAFQYRLPMMVYLNIEPTLKEVRQMPRVKELMQEIFGKPSAVPQQKTKYKKASLSPAETELYYTELQNIIHKEAPFLKPNLGLRELARMLDLHPNKLSELLNDKIGKNFSAFINYYRVEHFKSLAILPENSHLSLLGIAYDSGFNSKTSFNTFFKKETGMTPKAYLKQQTKA
jgi:TolB-like protein/AraC-like DNA-binding protein